ncbi:MAG: hypothetical protein EGQ63_08070 [Clostridiales bacterium]|nr:hypothetical protein [Clostridiales bacterium]
MAVKIDTSMAGNTVASTKENSSNSSLDKDAFLQLLVTQMQYQDPLEPTSNTEYMAQLAQFSSVEELQNLSSTFSTGQAMNLTGQYVILNVPDSTGEIKQVSGLVDYVTVTDGKAYFHIGDEYYSSDYLDSVVSLDYLKHLADQEKENKTDGNNKADNNKTEDTAKADGNADNQSGKDQTTSAATGTDTAANRA